MQRPCISSLRPAGPWWLTAILKGEYYFVRIRMAAQFLPVGGSVTLTHANGNGSTHLE